MKMLTNLDLSLNKKDWSWQPYQEQSMVVLGEMEVRG